MADVKRCKQCGILKDASKFRPYTYSKAKETSGRFSICRACEAINSKYSKAKAQVENFPLQGNVQALADIEVIESLYETLESHGFHTPLSRGARESTKSTADMAIDKLLTFYADVKPVKQTVAVPTEPVVDIPDELNHWLTGQPEDWKEKGISPEFLQETIYESLKAKYRPQVGIDQDKFVPIYDDTYKTILNDILRKFDDYEEMIGGEESDTDG